MEKYAVTPEELAELHICLSSKLCRRIFNILWAERKPVNISAICRKAGCTSGNAVKHLKRLVKLGVVEERLLPGLHMFSAKREEMAELMFKAANILEARDCMKWDKEGLYAAGNAYPHSTLKPQAQRIQPQFSLRSLFKNFAMTPTFKSSSFK
ncbi:MAG: helix-turn-helix domain-containing protein [Candidatus Bathyarchaeia archaeon]